jgi:hypothetical protein
MNRYQQVWWEQTCADHGILRVLRKRGASPCHQLHYLQMVTEKLGKAYFWRAGRPPRKTHASFVRFLQALDDRPTTDVQRIATLLGFGRPDDLERWIPTITPLAYDLERLAPDLAGFDSANAEYPWPHAAPTHAPASYSFPVWANLTETGRGRQLLRVIDAAVLRFPDYG